MRSVGRATLSEIARNFDFVHTINAQRYMITGPGRFETNIKTYPFTITNDGKDLPIIGVIDTEVSAETPLASLPIITKYTP